MAGIASIPVGGHFITFAIRYTASLTGSFQNVNRTDAIPNDELVYFNDDDYIGFDWQHRSLLLLIGYQR